MQALIKGCFSFVILDIYNLSYVVFVHKGHIRFIKEKIHDEKEERGLYTSVA